VSLRVAALPRPGAAGRRRVLLLRALLAAALGVGAALLIACGSSGKGLIPSANATPLQSDFEEVSQAAQNGNGSCTATEAALAKTESDFNALPASIDAGLRTKLREGITNLHERALKLCAQPLSGATTTGTTAKTTTTSTDTTPTTTTQATTSTQTTPTETTPTQTGTTPSTGPGGGTAAPGETEAGKGNGDGGGVGPGGQGPPGQEGGK
jgi:hypothetical protein